MATSTRTSQQLRTGPGARALRILVVDDEADIRDSLSPLLAEALGARVETAPDGLAARRRLSQEAFDLVIADQRMPGLSGTELLEWLCRERPDARRVLMSAFEDSFAGVYAMACRPRLFLRKPFRLAEAKPALERVLAPDARPVGE